MATLMQNDSRRKYSWWWDSHISPKNSKWLQENLTDMDRNVKAMIKLIEEDADSFARRAEMYYKKRPELMKLVEEFYRAYRALAERYDNATGALRQAHRTMAEAFPNQIPPLLNDESPSSSGSEFRPRTPEMPSPLQAPLDSDDLNMHSSGSSPHLHVRRYSPLSEDSKLLPSKRGLKQLKELFPSGEVLNRPNSSEGKVRKGLNFKEEGGKSEEIKRLQDQVSDLSSRNENLMAQVTLESHHAQTLEELLSSLEAEKEATLLRYKVSIERISTLEADIIHTRGELNKVNEVMITKLNNVEEQCLIMEKKNQSLQFELEFQQKQLEKQGRELEELNTSIEEEHQKMVLAQEEIQSDIEKLKEMELNKAGLEEKISELKEIVDGLHERNISLDTKIRDLQEEIKSLKETNQRVEDESRGYVEKNEALLQELCCLKEDQNGFEQMHRGFTEQMEVIAVKNELLENCLLDADSEVKGLREKSEELEGLCEALVGEVCTCVVEKGVMVSHIKGITQSMERLLKNNTDLENSLSDANAELEGLRAMYKDLEGSCWTLRGQYAILLSEKNTLLSEVENFESKYLGLQEQQLNLERENDAALHQIKELENSLKLEKQGNKALIMSYASQLASLHDQIYILKEDIQVKEKNFEVEQQKAINSLFEIFILQRSLSDINDNNLVLNRECRNLLEASRSTENQISQLGHEKFIQKKELALLSEHNEILKKGINVLSEELRIDVKHGKTINATTIESLIQTIHGEVKSLLNAISDTRDENQHLHLEVVNLENKYLNIQDQHSSLEREKDSLVHKVMELENSSRLVKQEHEALVLSFSSQFASLQNEIHHLQEEIHVKEEAFEVEQLQNLNALLENFVLKRCLGDMQDGNLFLSGEFQTLLEECRCAEQQICRFRDKELIQKKERSLLKGRILEVLEALNIDVKNGSMDELKDEVLLQTILGEIRSLLLSVLDAHDENECLHLQLSVVATLLKQIGLDKFHLHHELDSRSEELLAVGSKKQELIEINEQLNSEKDILVLQVVNLERKYLNLQDQHMSLESEKDSLVHKVMELESSSIQEKQEHEAFTFSLSSQLASLQNKIHHLQEDIHVSEEALEIEQQSTENAFLENFVLKRSLRDMKYNNVILSGECCSLLEASKCSEQQICQLKDKDLIQMKELSLLSNHIDTVQVGILLLSEALNIDVKHGSVDECKDEVILQASLGEIKSLLTSVSDAHDENQRLQLEVSVVRTLLNQIGLDKIYLHGELESRSEELLASESKTHELADINEKLYSEKGILVYQVEILRHNLEISEKNYSGLESTCMILENEKSSLLHQVAELECSLKLEKEELEMEQQKNMGSLLKVFILQRCIDDLKDKNLLLSSDCQKLLEAYSCSVKLIAKFEHKCRSQETEMMLLLDNRNKLKDGVLLLLKELNINEEFGAIDRNKCEGLLQTLNVEIKKLLNSLQNVEEESHGRHLQMSILLTLLKHIGLEREQLYHEIERQTEELLCMQNKKNEAMEINGQLKAQLQRSETEICNLIEENRACSERFNDLKEEKAALNEDNINVIFYALKLENLLVFFENTCAEKISNLTLLSDDISSLLAVKDDLYEEIKVQNKRMKEMEIEKENEVAEAQEENAELCRKLEYANRDLDVANMAINELKEKIQILSSDNASKDEKIMGSMETNGLLIMELERLNCELEVFKKREEYLSSELKKRISDVNESEGEIERWLSETQFSMLSAAILKERVFELLVACEGQEISAFLHRERFSEEIVSRNARVDKMKEKLRDLEGERSTLQAQLDAYSLLLVSLCDSFASLEEHIFLLTKIQKRQDDESSYTPGNKKSSHTTAKGGFLELQKLIPKVEVLQKMIIDTKTLLKQEKLISPMKDVSKEKYGEITKDIQLDQASRSYKIKNAESDDQMLELWETAAGDDIEAVEEVKSEYPSSELVAEKELSIDKLEVTTRVKKSPQELTKRLTEKLDSDAQRVSVLQSSVHGLQIKLDRSEKKQLSKNSKYGTVKLQLREAEEDILEQVNLNCELKKKVEDSFTEKEKRQISEEVTGASEKIEKLELEVQKIEYIFLKVEEEEENKRVRYVNRKASILLKDYIYTRTDGRLKKRKGSFCGCMKPKTKA